jgi:predicted GIY-YIG superfamily endonuclease
MREGRFYKFWVYIMASRTGTLYTGMTGFVDTRIFQPQIRRDRGIHEAIQMHSTGLF